MEREVSIAGDVAGLEGHRRERLGLWIVNQYAQRDGQPGITRHATLARLMHPLGVRTTILAAEGQYWAPRRGVQYPVAQRAGAATHVVVPAPSAESNGAKRVYSMAVFSAMAVVKGWRPIEGTHPDVVMGSSPHPFGAVAGWILAKRHQAAFVLEVRDIWPKSLITMLGTPRWHPFVVLLSLIEKFLYSRADAIVTLLPGSEGHIRSVSASAAEIHYVPNGVDAAAEPSPGGPSDRNEFVVMYAGAHGVPNALDTLIGAAAIVAEREAAEPPSGGPMQIVLVGDGKEKAHLRELARRVAPGCVTFRDPVPKAEIIPLLSGADVLVLTLMDSPVFQDGISPNKLFDYMAAERPVVMSVDTPHDPVREARAGLTVPPGDPHALAEALLRLRALPIAERAAMGARGRAYVESNHDMGVLAHRLSCILEGLVGRQA